MAIQKIYRCIRNDGAEGSPDYAEYIPDLSARALSDAAGRGIEENYVRTEQLRSGVQGMRTLSESGSGDVGGAYTPVYLRNGYLVPATNVMDLVSDQIVGGSKRFEGPVTLAGSTSVTGPSTISGDVALSGCTVDLTGVALRVNGSQNIGSASKPIYLKDGVPTECEHVLADNVAQTITASGEKTFEANFTIPLKMKTTGTDISKTPVSNTTSYDSMKLDKNSATLRRLATIHRSSGSVDHRLYVYGENSGSMYADATLLADGRGYFAIPSLPSGFPSSAIANIGDLEASGANAKTNLMHTVGNENAVNTKTFNDIAGTVHSYGRAMHNTYHKLGKIALRDTGNVEIGVIVFSRYTMGMFWVTYVANSTGGLSSVTVRDTPMEHNILFGGRYLRFGGYIEVVDGTSYLVPCIRAGNDNTLINASIIGANSVGHAVNIDRSDISSFTTMPENYVEEVVN